MSILVQKLKSRLIYMKVCTLDILKIPKTHDII